jgi:hypothetical protein
VADHRETDRVNIGREIVRKTETDMEHTGYKHKANYWLALIGRLSRRV